MALLFNLLVLFLTIFILVYKYFEWMYQYWEKRRFPFLKPTFPLGNSPTIIRKARIFALETMNYYDEMKKKGLKFAGVFLVLRPALVVIDPDYIKDILVKDFQYFVDRGVYHRKEDVVSNHLFSVDGSTWRSMRVQLTPTFTSGKMKMMFPDIVKISNFIYEAVEKKIKNNDDIDIKEYLSRFTCDVIGCCAFGIDCNSFKNPNAEFWQFGCNIFSVKDYLHLISLIVQMNAPELARKMGLKALRSDVTEFCKKVVKETIDHRETNHILRPDFLQLLMDMKKKDNSIDFGQMAAQCFLFFAAGFETSSTAMKFALYELSRNSDAQEKARKEINEVLEKYQGELTYENIKEMTYLQQVLDEALRIYPPLPNIQRVCIQDYKLKDTDLIIEKGMQIIIPNISIQRDPQYFPDPEKFDPDRFAPELKKARNQYLFLPFGEGPRNCIGLRFGVMQSLVGLVTLLKKFRWEISPKTKMPLTLNVHKAPIDSDEVLYLRAFEI